MSFKPHPAIRLGGIWALILLMFTEKFIPCFLKCLLQVRLHCVHYVLYNQGFLTKAHKGWNPITVLVTPLQTKYLLMVSSLKISAYFGASFWVIYLLREKIASNQAASTGCGMMWQTQWRSFLFCLRKSSHSPSLCLTDDVQPSSRSLFLLLQHRTSFLLSNANPLNLAPSVHSRCFIPSPVLCLCSFAHLNLFPLVPDVAFSFHFCREARIVEFPLYCRCWDWGFVDTV